MTSVSKTRLAHVDANMDLRLLKARKIAALLELNETSPISGKLLEIGTGSGWIASYFAHHPNWNLSVTAVDVVDNRQIHDGFAFQLVKGCKLPFADASFDFVISNHVIEHVGERSDQLMHLLELKRVLKPEGIGYLAMPNRWMLVEPHYNLIFLSWIPKRWRSRYLKWCRGVGFYDCEPLSLVQFEQLINETGLMYENIGVAAIRKTLELEYPPDAALRKLFNQLPDAWVQQLSGAIPTLIYRFRNSEAK